MTRELVFRSRESPFMEIEPEFVARKGIPEMTSRNGPLLVGERRKRKTARASASRAPGCGVLPQSGSARVTSRGCRVVGANLTPPG